MKDITESIDKAEIEQSMLALEAFEPGEAHRIWEVTGLDGNKVVTVRRYVQEELSFFTKQDFITLMTDYVDRFAAGEFGISLKDIWGDESSLRQRIQIPTEFEPEQAEKMVQDNSNLIRGVLGAAKKIPGLEIDIILIALGIPRSEREWAKGVLTGPVYMGGLSDEHGFEILKTFIRQNAGAIRSFFEDKARELYEVFEQEVLGTESSAEDSQPEQPEAEEKEETTQGDGDTPGGTPSSITPPEPASIPTTSGVGPPPASS